MLTFSVRDAQARDFDALLRLLDQMDEGVRRPHPAGSRNDLRALFESILSSPDQALLVAEDGGRVVGTAHVMVLRQFRRGLPRSAVVEGVVVDPACRRRGVGAALMRAAADRAREAGCYKLDLTSNMARSGAHRFYSRLGWKRTHFGYSVEL